MPREKAVTASRPNRAAGSGLRIAAATAVSPTVMAAPKARGAGGLGRGDPGPPVPRPGSTPGQHRELFGRLHGEGPVPGEAHDGEEDAEGTPPHGRTPVGEPRERR